MGVVWEASQKGVPFLGVPGNSLNMSEANVFFNNEQAIICGQSDEDVFQQ